MPQWVHSTSTSSIDVQETVLTLIVPSLPCLIESRRVLQACIGLYLGDRSTQEICLGCVTTRPMLTTKHVSLSLALLAALATTPAVAQASNARRAGDQRLGT